MIFCFCWASLRRDAVNYQSVSYNSTKLCTKSHKGALLKLKTFSISWKAKFMAKNQNQKKSQLNLFAQMFHIRRVVQLPLMKKTKTKKQPQTHWHFHVLWFSQWMQRNFVFLFFWENFSVYTTNLYFAPEHKTQTLWRLINNQIRAETTAELFSANRTSLKRSSN